MNSAYILRIPYFTSLVVKFCPMISCIILKKHSTSSVPLALSPPSLIKVHYGLSQILEYKLCFIRIFQILKDLLESLHLQYTLKYIAIIMLHNAYYDRTWACPNPGRIFFPHYKVTMPIHESVVPSI